MKSAILLAVVIAASFAPSLAQARQYVGSDGRVVHTRRAPVVMHRVLPPFKGQHIYEGGGR